MTRTMTEGNHGVGKFGRHFGVIISNFRKAAGAALVPSVFAPIFGSLYARNRMILSFELDF